MKKYIATLILIFISGHCLGDSAVSEIKVFDPKFKIIKVVNKTSEILKVLSYWEDVEVEKDIKLYPLDDREYYKVDFVTDNKALSGRWLYIKSGYYRILSKTTMKTYRVRNASALNEALGI